MKLEFITDSTAILNPNLARKDTSVLLFFFEKFKGMIRRLFG